MIGKIYFNWFSSICQAKTKACFIAVLFHIYCSYVGGFRAEPAVLWKSPNGHGIQLFCYATPANRLTRLRLLSQASGTAACNTMSKLASYNWTCHSQWYLCITSQFITWSVKQSIQWQIILPFNYNYHIPVGRLLLTYQNYTHVTVYSKVCHRCVGAT